MKRGIISQTEGVSITTMPRSSGRQIKFIDVFSGCGGLSLGLSQAGLEGQFAIEHSDMAFETFDANFLQPDSPYKFEWPSALPQKAIGIEDILALHTHWLKELADQIDILAGGPPCQGFSSAGRRRSDDPRNQLFKSYLQLVQIIRPKVVLIENVRGFTVDFRQTDGHANYSAMLSQELSLDYNVYSSLLNLSDFGVPQNRVRYFVLAFRKDVNVKEPFVALKQMLPGFLRNLGLQVPVSSWAAISDLEIERCGTRHSAECKGFDEIKYVGPQSRYQRLMATPNGEPSDLRLARHSAVIASRFADIIRTCHADGRLNTSISNEVRARFNLKKCALRVLDPDRPSPTITSMPDDLLHYKEARTLTVRESARLQSFPDWFAFRGKYTTGGERRRYEVPRFTQVANAVPPLAGYAIGLLLRNILDEAPAQSFGRLKRVSKSPKVTA